MKKRISQSLLKSLQDFQRGKKCGLVVKAQYIDYAEFPTSQALELGQFFEYRATGGLPRNGEVPQPKLLKSGELPAAFARMETQVENYKRMVQAYDLEIEHIGYSFNHPCFSGVADVVGHMGALDGEQCIIDIKTSGRIDDKYSEFGWGDEKFEYPESPNAMRLLVQALQYKLLAKHEWGVDNIPFFFWVFSTTNEFDCKIIEVVVDDERLALHEKQLWDAHSYLNDNFMRLTDKELAKPNYRECVKCPIMVSCEHKQVVPKPLKVYVS